MSFWSSISELPYLLFSVINLEVCFWWSYQWSWQFLAKLSYCDEPCPRLGCVRCLCEIIRHVEQFQWEKSHFPNTINSITSIIKSFFDSFSQFVWRFYYNFDIFGLCWEQITANRFNCSSVFNGRFIFIKMSTSQFCSVIQQVKSIHSCKIETLLFSALPKLSQTY